MWCEEHTLREFMVRLSGLGPNSALVAHLSARTRAQDQQQSPHGDVPVQKDPVAAEAAIRRLWGWKPNTKGRRKRHGTQSRGTAGNAGDR